MVRSIENFAAGFTFTEGPRWHDGRLWISDFYSHRVLAISLDGEVDTIVEVPGQPSGLGWLPDGKLLVVSMRDQKLMRLEGDELVEHADLGGIATGWCNDMVVDSHGRAYVGNFGFDLMSGESYSTAALMMVTPEGGVHEVATGLHFPNGSVITPDGKTLLVNESYGNRISAFGIRADGTLGPRRDWAKLGPEQTSFELNDMFANIASAPDGGCLDAEGAVWYADARGNKVVRVKEGGEVLEEVSFGDEGAYACMLGGDAGTTLFVCLAPDHFADKRSAAREARVVAVEVDVPHAGLP